MAGTRPSSKRKSSKRKSSKISSEARKKKRTRRIKSRKLRHRDDSSSYPDDDSRSSVFISSSSFEDESRARSRKRSEVKGGRKRTRRSSSSRGSSEVSRLVKKRKGSKRSNSSNTRKKSQKKNRKRQPSVSSSRSDLRSCSTCRGTSISGESEFERPRSRSRDKSKDKRDVGKAKRETKRIKSRSRSCSSCCRHSDSSGYSNKDMLPVENSFRRLKSVITVAKPPDEEDKNCGKDGHKEEIVYDHDEYPSCRSNDSNDGGSKRELARLSPVDLERRSENPKEEGGFVSDTRMTKLKKGGEEGGTLDSQSNTHADKVGADNSSMGYKSEIFFTLSNSNGDDLESQLKLKALENLRKHRAGLQMNSKPLAGEEDKIDSDVGQLSTPDIDSVRNKSLKGDGSRIVDATRVLHQNPRPTKGRDSSHFATSHGKAQEREVVAKESERATRTVICPPNREAINGSLKTEDLSSAGVVPSKSELGKLALRQESSGTILKQPPKVHVLLTQRVVNKSSAETPCPPNQVAIPDNSKAEASKSEVGKSGLRQESAGTLLKQTPDACVLMTERLVNKSSAETSESVGQTNNNNGVGVSNVGESSTTDPSSSVKTALGEYSLKEQQGEGKESSQLQEKTISRMRGGEMVQVSYQVYIPKKAPALARRQLRR